MNRKPLFSRWLFAAVLAAFPSSPCSGEEAETRADRLDGLVESLNSTSTSRSRALEVIHNELRGPDSREMQTMLRDALGRSNSLIVQGAVEALAMLGDPQDLGAVEALLATTNRLEVKNLAIRLLPAFCLVSSERARFNYVAYAAGHQRIPPPSVLESLRRPPLTRRGGLNQTAEQMQTRVTRVLVRQFDPVGAAMPFIDDMYYNQAARATVVYYVGQALGNDPSRWARVWAAQGRDMEYLAPDEIVEIRLSALASIADMGAEGLPELVAAFGWLFQSDDSVLKQSAFETMGVMCDTGFTDYEPLASMNFSRGGALEAENWRSRRFASSHRLAIFAIGRAAAALPSANDTGLFAAAANCMAAALDYPTAFPDPDGTLAAAREQGLIELQRMLLLPDVGREQRAAVATALGRGGSVGAVAALTSILQSPYCSPEFGQDGLRMAEAAVDALQLAAVGNQEGRNTARVTLLALLTDERLYQPVRSGTPPVGLAHLVLWRLQRLARSTDTARDPEGWRLRLGW